MTPEHKALVAAGAAMANILYNLTQARSFGAPELHASMNDAREEWDRCRAAIESLSARCAQPQAGEPVAEQIADAVLSWMVKFDLLDAGNEYGPEDVLAVLNDLAPASPQPANPAQDEPDFARSIAEVIKEESAGGAACGWKSCSGCHETNEGAETGHYPYSKMFGCYVGSGCSECGGLGVVWDYWSDDALKMMAVDASGPANPARVTDASEDRYRKKPVVIEAFQMTKERRMDNSDWPNWLHKAWNGTRNEAGTLQRVDMDAPLPDYLQIVTLEGLHLVSWGDWIIQGVKGELYPCKPDIFAATYEPALTAAIGAGGQAVAVKALEWDDEIWGWQAFPEIGEYRVEDQGLNWNVDRFWMSHRGAILGKFASSDDAFAAAQADYEQRIRSALSQPHPTDERVVEALPYAWANVRVEDTGDGLIIHPDDARKWGLDNDRDYTGSFLPDGRFRIALATGGRNG